MKFLVTGIAGFIGYHVGWRLLSEGHQVIGIDNLNDYYDVSLKNARLNCLKTCDRFQFHKLDLIDFKNVAYLFKQEQFSRVIHLGAQSGVRNSSKNPLSYGNTNLIGHLNILEGCRHNRVEHLLYASSSSVYGLNRNLPFSTTHSVDHPISLYAATKRANELMAHTYAYLYHLPITGLRFFTVYGPWGRPDMALFKFTRAILNGDYINVYNQGEIFRDFTFIDDITESIIRLQAIIPISDIEWTTEIGSPADSSAPYRIYNIGSGYSVNLMNYIQTLENVIGIKAKKNLLPMQPGDILETIADVRELHHTIGFRPKTPVQEGIKRFVDWYRKYYQC